MFAVHSLGHSLSETRALTTTHATHAISRGFDIRLTGSAAPESRFDTVDPPVVGATAGVIPGAQMRALVGVGDRVRRGDPVLTYRDSAGVFVVAPASGEVVGISRGSERASMCVEIARDASRVEEFAELDLPSLSEVATFDREKLAAQLRGSGLWPLLRERPVGGTPLSGPPDAVFINFMDTEPLAADPTVLLLDREDDLKHGLAILGRLSEGPLYLCLPSATNAAIFDDLPAVEVHRFGGPHPAGLPGTHINRIAPLGAGVRYWTIRAQDLARIGECARTQAFPSHRLVAMVGPGASQPGYYKTHEGAPLRSLVGELGGDSRILQGTVLSAFAADIDSYLAMTVHTVTVIGEGKGQRPLLGWARPGFNHPSASRATLGWLRRRPAYPIDARLHGESRAIVNIGAWDKVMPLDLHMSSLVRAIQAGDLEEALALGLLDLVEEDVALCTYVDPCKLDVGAVIRRGLDQYVSEQGGA